jgi:RimJ/RimL family protein N-acetyltransferase
MSILTSSRLTFRPWDPERDAEHAIALYGDPLVLRYIGNPPPATTAQQVKPKLEAYANVAAKYGDGSMIWAVERKDLPGIPIGTGLFKQLVDGDGKLLGDYEIGWHLRQDEWGKDLGTEIGWTMLQAAVDRRPDIPVIIAIAYPENTPSIAIMRKMGMREIGLTDKYYGLNALMHQITPNEATANLRARAALGL